MEKPHGKGEPMAKDQKLITIFTTSLEPFSCHRCKELLGTRAYWCKNGHLMCTPCHAEKKGRCGNCDDTIGDRRHVLVEQIMADFLIYCKYRKDGCEMRISLSEKRTHEHYCGYKPY